MPKEKKKDNLNSNGQPQKGTGSPKAESEPVVLAGRIDTLEGAVNLINKNLTLVNDTNRFILIILFIGLIALLFSVLVANIQATIANTNAQIEFTKSLQQIENALPRK